MIKDESAQAGGIIMFVFGIFIVGFLWVAFGAIMSQIQTTNNDIISAGQIPYSQEHWDTMDLIFKYWLYLPVFIIILFVIFAIKNALTKNPTEV